MTTPVIITVAITGALPRKKDNPAVPVTPAEQIESTHEAFEAGASLVHIHVRNPDESPASDPALYGAVQEGVRKHCPGMIVQFSTGGRGRDQAARGAMLDLRPDMASLATGSVNFPTNIYENPPDFVEQLARTMLEYDIKPEVEVFDLAMLYNAANLVKKGLIKEKPHVQFVMGIPERDADAPVRLQFPALRARRRAAGRDVGRSRHRTLPVGSEPDVPGSRRTLPDGARGQHALRRDAARGEQCRARAQDRRCVRALRPAARDGRLEARQILGLRPCVTRAVAARREHSRAGRSGSARERASSAANHVYLRVPDAAVAAAPTAAARLRHPLR